MGLHYPVIHTHTPPNHLRRKEQQVGMSIITSLSFKDMKTKAQQGHAAYPRSHKCQVTELGNKHIYKGGRELDNRVYFSVSCVILGEIKKIRAGLALWYTGLRIHLRHWHPI